MRRNHLFRVLTGTQLARYLCTSTPTGVGLKNVTKSNFEPAVAELRGLISRADFVSIDLEMTGVTSSPWREVFEFDRFDVQYLKIKDSAEKFAVVQFGVCPFRWDPQSHSFVAHPHNFYIFPRQELAGDGSSTEFLCQTSSLEFLAKYQLDFNACIYEGVSYLSRSQEEEELKQLDSVYEDELPESSCNLTTNKEFIRMADILFYERMKNTINEWRSELLGETNKGSEFKATSDGTNQKFQTTFFKMRPAFVVNAMTSRQLRLIKLVTERHFNDLTYVHVSGETSGSKSLIVYTDSTTDRDALMKDLRSCQRFETEKKIKSAIGFRHVIDMLSSERKLIVGHNCFLDLAHIYSKFVGPLHSTAQEFVSALHACFPHIIDTKVMLNLDDVLSRIMKNGSTSLSTAFSLLCSPSAWVGTSAGLTDKSHVRVEVEVDGKRFSNWNSGSKHEAGYDAFMTGCVFSQAISHLGVDFNSHDFPQNVKLRKYANHLYLSWVNGDLIDLTGKTASNTILATKAKRNKFEFSNMILLCGLQPTLRANDIRTIFHKALGSSSIMTIHHLDATSVLVQFSKAGYVSEFLELKDKLERDKDPLSVLHPLFRILEGRRVRAVNYEMYKKICGSPLSEMVFANQAEAIGIIDMKEELVEQAIGVEM